MTDIFKLYYRPGCRSCLHAELELGYAGCAFERVNIDLDLGLGAQFGLRIPVLAHASGAQLDWPFDAGALLDFLAALPADSAGAA